IWNYKLSGSDSTYLLDFVSDDQKKMSYASSFGLEEIEESKKNMYIECLSKITKMSVREESGAEIIDELIGYKPTVVLDPCLLLSKDEWVQETISERS